MQDQPKPNEDPAAAQGENLGGRRCANCACSFLIPKPAVMPPGMKAADFDAIRDQRVCRLDPPSIVTNPKTGAQGLSQRPVSDNNVCWHWRMAGTLPGDTEPKPQTNLERAIQGLPAIGSGG